MLKQTYTCISKNGLVRLERVTQHDDGTRTINPISAWLPVQEVKTGMASFQIRMMRVAIDDATRQGAERQLLKLFRVRH